MIRCTTFAGRKVAIFGLARSGIATGAALAAGGADVACWDDGDAGRAVAYKARLPVVDLVISTELVALAPANHFMEIRILEATNDKESCLSYILSQRLCMNRIAEKGIDGCRSLISF